MPKSKFSEAQIVAALRQVEAGRAAAEVAREVGVTVHTIYAWKAKYGGMDVSEAQEAGNCAKRMRGCVSWWRT